MVGFPFVTIWPLRIKLLEQKKNVYYNPLPRQKNSILWLPLDPNIWENPVAYTNIFYTQYLGFLKDLLNLNMVSLNLSSFFKI